MDEPEKFDEDTEDLELKAYQHHTASWEDTEMEINTKMTVEIHIRDADPKRDIKKLERIQKAVAGFLEGFGFTPDPENQTKEIHASWHWYEWFRSKLPFVRSESKQVYEDMKEALRRRHLDQVGAEAFKNRATSVAELLNSIEPFADVVIRLGDIVVVKATVDGVARLGIETLSPELARKLDATPYAMRNSAAFYEFMEEQKVHALAHETTNAALPSMTSKKPK